MTDPTTQNGPPEVTIGKRGQTTWCVYIDGQFVSDHATRDGAVRAANNHIRVEVERRD